MSSPDPQVIERALSTLRRHRDSVDLPEAGAGWREPESAWWRIVGQICAVGSSRSWEALEDPAVRRELSIARIRHEGPLAASHVHRVLSRIGVRYCSPQHASSQKAEAIAANAASAYVADAEGRVHLLAQLEQAVGDRGIGGLWPHAQACGARRVLIRNLQFFGPKSASDFLVGLGVADSLLALDVRLLNLLIDFLGWDPGCRQRVHSLARYEELEQQVVDTFCQPLGIRPAHLDRLLFSKYQDLRTEWADLSSRSAS